MATVMEQTQMEVGVEDGNSNTTYENNSLKVAGTDSEVGNSAVETPQISVIIKWSGKEYVLEDISGLKTVGDLKAKIMEKTKVKVDRQKLLNLMYKGKQAVDSCSLTNLNLKPNIKIMMMGSLEQDIAQVDIPPEDRPEITNDLDIPDDEDVEEIETSEIYLNKISRRVKEYKINVINPPRPGKKLLVLDIDYTIFDHRSPAQCGAELMRPGLHEFLTAAYEHYDIAIWSATSMKWIEEKMKLLGVNNNPNYKIVFYVDYLAMITVHTQKYGVVEIKPLGVIWGHFPQYSAQNSIMFDDCRRNFLMNPHNGLRIRPFRQAHIARDTDRELYHLTDYLIHLSALEDISTLEHRNWEFTVRKAKAMRRKLASKSKSKEQQQLQ